MMDRPDYGVLVISLDFELHWGVRDHYTPDGAYRRNLLGARRAIPLMLDLFERYDIAATWATVGFLFAASREERERFSPVIQPRYENPALSPYDEPTGEGEADDPLHYAPGLIAEIVRRPRQEVATHTYSHYYCLDPGQTRMAFKADLESAVNIARAHSLTLRSIVFPRNQVNLAHVDVLRECGIVCYRGTESGWMYRPAADARKARILNARRADRYLNLSGFNLTNWDDVPGADGLCNVPASRFLNPYQPRLRRLEPARLRRIVEGLRAAAERKRIFHLWWHPHNFGVYTEENIAFLGAILEVFSHLHGSYGMRSLTMAEVASIAEGRVSRCVPVLQS